METDDRDLEKQKHNEYLRKWRKNNKDKKQEHERRARKKYPQRYAKYSLKYHHGITLSQKEEKLREQDGKCAICGGSKPGGRNDEWIIDHNHSCPKHHRRHSCVLCRRGILCSNCNLALGHVHDNPEILRKMLDYLNKYSHKKVLDKQPEIA